MASLSSAGSAGNVGVTPRPISSALTQGLVLKKCPPVLPMGHGGGRGVGERPSLLNQIPLSEAASLNSPLARTWSAQRTVLRFTVLFQFISLGRWIRDWPHLPLEGPHLGAQTPVCEGCPIPGSGDPPTPIGHLLPGERPTKDSGLRYNGPMGTSTRGSGQTGNSRDKGTPSTPPASHTY